MCQTPFYQTSNQLEDHFLNIEQTRTCSSIGDRTRTSYHWLRTSNFEAHRAFTRFTKLLIELTRKSFFRTSNELERVHLLIIELEHPILASNDLTLNFEHSSTHHQILIKDCSCQDMHKISVKTNPIK